MGPYGPIITYYLFERMRIMITKEQLDEYCRLYSQGKPAISDSEYDRLLEEYLERNGEDKRPFLRQKQSDSVASLVGTLPKVYGVTTPMREGQKTYEQWFNTKKINPKSKIIIQPKFDGCSVCIDALCNFYTRGDYDNGESVDVTELFKPYFNQQFHEAVDGVKFEAIISKEVFKDTKMFESYNTPRDAVSGIISSRNTELSKLITLVPLRESILNQEWVCEKLQDISIVTTTADDFDTIQQFINDKLYDGAQVLYNGQHYAIDGVVVSVIDEDSSTTEEIAIKILNDINETKLVRVDFQFGKTGRITPVAIVEPTLFCDGKRTVDHITLSTIERVVDMGLKHGDTVKLMYNIVPYFLDSYHDGTIPIQVPTECPICGAPLDFKTLKQVHCTNPECAGLRAGIITRYAIHMKMFGISEATISRFFNEGVISSISDLYKLTIDDIIKLDGFRETSARNIVNSIKNASEDVPVARWLGALPFKDVNAKTWDLILNELFGRDELQKSNSIRFYLKTENHNAFLDDCMVKYIPGIGPATRKAIHEGWLKNFDEMSRIVDFITFKITTNVSNPGVKGRVTFTGVRDDNLVKLLTEAGYEVNDFSTTKTKYLIVPDERYANNKTMKANTVGIPVITITDAYSTLI